MYFYSSEKKVRNKHIHIYNILHLKLKVGFNQVPSENAVLRVGDIYLQMAIITRIELSFLALE